MVTVTVEQRANLAKLAAYLEENASTLNFDMQDYMLNPVTNSPLKLHERHPCGSVGCAIGHGPAAGIPILNNQEDWDDYANDSFGSDVKLWDGLFNHSWAYINNTPLGAANRIRKFLNTGFLGHPRTFEGSES
jgi:hypothetical protein